MNGKQCSRYIKAWFCLSSALVVSLQATLLWLFWMGEQLGWNSWSGFYVGGSLLVSSLMMGLLALAAAYTTYRIGRVFQMTTDALNQLSRGDSVRLSFHSSEELSDLAQAFNSAAASHESAVAAAGSIPRTSGEAVSHAYCCQWSEPGNRPGVLPSGQSEGP